MSAEDPFQGINSQEYLPLSQESYSCLLNQLQSSTQDFSSRVNYQQNSAFCSVYGNASELRMNTYVAEQIGNSLASIQVPSHLSQPIVPSSLPASESWPGQFSFEVSFKDQENVKGVAWIYSKLKNKLYVNKGVPCPVNFSTSALMPADVSVRAMALFSSPDHSSEVVSRCINHSMEEIANDVFEAEHLIRCESSRAFYEKDPVTGRHSVVVPYENSPAGQHFSTYIYKFMCFGSCSGGPNRRPMMLVFTLERGIDIIGRCKVDLKVCACPGRDKRQEEQQLLPAEAKKLPVKRKEPSTLIMPELIGPQKCKKTDTGKYDEESEENGKYVLKVKTKRCYRFLKQMRKYYYMYEHMQLKLDDVKLFVYSSLSSSESD